MTAIRKAAVAALFATSCLVAPELAIAQQPEGTTLEELVVTGAITYRNRTETVAPELTYDQEFFEKFEPVSVGDQLKRVPGVAFTSDIGEKDAPQLRGLGQGFTQVLVNGRPVPGAGNDRTVFVDRIPAEIVDRIEIIRSPSADIDSQGVGGTINIILKSGASLPPGVIVRGGVNYDVDMKKWSPSGAVSVSGRNDDETILYSMTLDAQRRFNNKHTIQEVFDEDSEGFDDEVDSGGNGEGLVQFDNRDLSVATERVEEEDSRRSTDISFNGDITWRPSAETSVRLDAFYLRTKRKEHQDTTIYEGEGDAGSIELDTLESQDADMRQDSYGASLGWEQALSETLSFEGQLRFNQFKDDSVQETFEQPGDDPLDSETIKAKDTEWTLDGALKGKLPGLAESMGVTSIGYKVGAAGKSKNRDYGLFIADDLDELENEEEVYSDSLFTYEERRFDVFAMLEVELTEHLKLEVGVRAENTRTDQDFTNVFTENNPDPDEVEVTLQSGSASSEAFEVNPSAHIVWELTGSDQLRFSAARTVRRPSINQLVPAVERESPGDEDATIGNPDLEFETSVGLDVGYEHRFAGQGVLGINLFRRDIANLIALTGTGEDADSVGAGSGLDGDLYTYENLGDADVWGIEIDISTPLTFLGLDETGFFANYTKLWSEREDPVTGETIRLDYQPEYIYNFGLTQNFPSIEASMGFSYQKQGESRFVTLGEIETQEYGGNLEVFLEKRLGENVVIRLSGNNLLDAASRQTERGYSGDTGEEIADAQRDNDVDAFEVEHEESSPTILFTVRTVF